MLSPPFGSPSPPRHGSTLTAGPTEIQSGSVCCRRDDLEGVGDHRPALTLVAYVDLVVSLVRAYPPEAEKPGPEAELAGHELAFEPELASIGRGGASRGLQVGGDQRQHGHVHSPGTQAAVGHQDALVL